MSTPTPSAGRLWMPCPISGTCCFALWSRGTRPRLPFCRARGIWLELMVSLSAFIRCFLFMTNGLFFFIHDDDIRLLLQLWNLPGRNRPVVQVVLDCGRIQKASWSLGLGPAGGAPDEESPQHLCLRGINRRLRNQHPDPLEKAARTLASPRSLDSGRQARSPSPSRFQPRTHPPDTAEAFLCAAWC